MGQSILDPRDPRALRLLSYYRDAELRGAALLLRMAAHEAESWAQMNLTRHIADEARHAWLITARITALGASPAVVEDGYQRRMARAAGVPRTLLDLYAATLVAERRARARYAAHLASGLADAATAALLCTISADEVWHLDWVQRRLRSLAAEAGEARVAALVRRYEDADKVVTADLAVVERETLGFDISAPASAAEPG
jgi:bacterioferritin (cytochrome b1)